MKEHTAWNGKEVEKGKQENKLGLSWAKLSSSWD